MTTHKNLPSGHCLRKFHLNAGDHMLSEKANNGKPLENSTSEALERIIENGTDKVHSDEQSGQTLISTDILSRDTARYVDTFCNAAEDSASFRQPSKNLAQTCRLCLKALYDFSGSSAPDWATPGGLPQLYVDGFDVEQIWGQIEASTGVLKQLRKRVQKLEPTMQLLDEATEAALDELTAKAKGEQAASGSESSEDSQMGLEMDERYSGDEAAGQALNSIQPQNNPSKRSKRSEVVPNDEEQPLLPTEDDFLRLADMESFVQDAEEAAMKGNADVDGLNGEEDLDTDDEDLGGSDLEGLNPKALGGDSDNDSEEKPEGVEESNSDEEDAELARLLEGASSMIGKEAKASSSKQKRKRQGVFEEEAEDEEAYFYADFFGPGGVLPGKRTHETASPDLKRDVNEGLEEALEDNEPEDDEDSRGDFDSGSDTAAGNEMDEGMDPDARDALFSGLQVMLDRKRAEESGELDRGALSKANEEGMSAHERRLARMAERARKLEAENMGEKEWFMRGEARAGARPLNSALEIDVDFDRAMKPPPHPTEESTTSLEDLIKRRIAEQQFDDPVRREPPPSDLQKELADLDDKRSAKGLGEVYEEEYVRAKTGNTVEDKDEKVRLEARLVLKALFAKLDALSHFHFAPKPIVKDMAVQSEVPALAMEEVAPQVVSEAARQMPEEVYKLPGIADRKEERTKGKAERRRRRGAAKRQYKKGQEGKKQTTETSNIVGRKSAKMDALEDAAERRALRKEKRKRSREEEGPKISYTKSAAVFGRIQDARNSKPAKKAAPIISSKTLKL